MLSRTPVFIVTSSRPRVGKTLIARALTEFFPVQRRPVAAFDVNPDDFRLSEWLPAQTSPANLNDTRGEMALFDQLIMTDEVPKIVDLSHLAFERFLTVMRDIDFTVAARRAGIEPMVLFVPDGSDRAHQGYDLLRSMFPMLPLVPIFNEHLPKLATWRERFPSTRLGGEAVLMPALTPVVRSVVERPGFSFVGYVSRTTDTTSELYEWIKRMFISFRDLEVRLLLGGLQPQLRRSA